MFFWVFVMLEKVSAVFEYPLLLIVLLLLLLFLLPLLISLACVCWSRKAWVAYFASISFGLVSIDVEHLPFVMVAQVSCLTNGDLPVFVSIVPQHFPRYAEFLSAERTVIPEVLFLPMLLSVELSSFDQFLSLICCDVFTLILARCCEYCHVFFLQVSPLFLPEEGGVHYELHFY